MVHGMVSSPQQKAGSVCGSDFRGEFVYRAGERALR